MLYQIIEYVIAERFDNVFMKLIEGYNESKIHKNDFIENINSLGKERGNIRKIVECIKKKTIDFDYIDLERDCKTLLEAHDKKIKNNLGDLVYDIRNLFVHSYRSINTNEFELIESITHQFELLTINILEHYSQQDCP